MIANILTGSWIHTLGWVLVHFLWQGLAVAVLIGMILHFLRNRTAQTRYLAACAALGLLVMAPVVTSGLISTPTPEPEQVSYSAGPETEFESARSAVDPILTSGESTVAPVEMQIADAHAAEPSQGNWKQHALTSLETVLPWIVIGWIVGVLVLSLWRFAGWLRLQTIKKQLTKPIHKFWQQRVKLLADRMRITRTISLLESALIQVPSVIGWLRPVILVPSAALTGTTPQQLEAFLLHELAHIRRYDYLVNLLQTMVEILGFYHPATWWISRRIRIERENCCDDLAADMLGDKVMYARALIQMEHLRSRPANLAVAADGGSLWQRITRLVGIKSDAPHRSGWLIGVVIGLLIATGLASAVLTKDKKPTIEELINEHEANRTKIKSYILISETKSLEKTQMLHNGKKVPGSNIPPETNEIRTDGNRFYIREISPTAFMKPKTVYIPHDSRSRTWLWDGRHYYFYGHRTREYAEKYAKEHIKSEDGRKRLIKNALGSMVINTNPTDENIRKKIDQRRPKGIFRISLRTILDDADRITIKDTMQVINGSKCYVVEATKDKHRHLLWIDPDHGCNIAKQISWHQKKKLSELDNVTFRQMKNVWIPVAYDFQLFNTNGLASEDKARFRITLIQLDPDHHKLKSFVPDPPNNSAVKIAKSAAGREKYRFTWQNGKVMDKDGNIVLDCMLKKPSDSTEPGSKSLLKKHPTAPDLLDKYVATVDKINSFAATTESSMKATSLIEKGKKGQYWSTSEGYYNGQKALVRNKLWGWVNETMHFTKDNPYYKIRLWDGQFYYGYDANPNAKRPEGSVYIITAEEVNRKQKYSADSVIGEFAGNYIIGLLPNHTRRIDTILRQAETIKISNKTEKIGEISCYVMEAKTKWGD